METHNFEEVMEKIHQENAEALGVGLEEVAEMPFSEIEDRLREDRLRENKRNEYVESRVFGNLRLRLRDYLYRKSGGGNSLVFGDLYE